MKIEIKVVGNKVRWNAELNDIGNRLAEIGEAKTHGDLYTALGVSWKNEDIHATDSKFSFACNGFEKFVKKYVQADEGTKEEIENRARELLIRIDDWLRGLETAARRFSVCVEYPEKEEADE